MNVNQRRRRALSLIELLTALATVIVLIGLLGPAFSETRNRSALDTELGTLRNLMITAHTYANSDPNDILGPVHPWASSFWNDGYAEYGGGPGTMNYAGWEEPFDPRTRPLNQLLFGFERGVGTPETMPGDRSVFKEFQCLGQDLGWQEWPGFGTDPRETDNSYFTANGTSFRMNNLSWADGKIAGIYSRPVYRIPAPSQTCAFMETRAFQTMWTNDTWGWATTHGELTGYHKKLGFFNLAYADGRAAFVDMGDGTFFEQRPDLGNRDVRGTWGRFDCSPDPLLDDD